MPGPRRSNRRRPDRRRPPRARRLAFAAAAAVLGLLGLEVLARITLGLAPALGEVAVLPPGGRLYAELEFHPALLWRLAPGRQEAGGVVVRINEDHMRGPPLPPVGAAREVVFLGDSSVFGWGVPEESAFAWASLPSDAGAVTVNAATPGYSSAQARLRLDDLLAARDPAVVVIATLWSDMVQGPWTDAELFARFGSAEAAAALSAHAWRSRSALYRVLRAGLLSRRPVPEDRRLLWDRVIRPGPVDGGRRRVSAADHRVHLQHMVRAARADGAVPVLLRLPTNPGTGLRPEAGDLAAYREGFSRVSAAEDAALVELDAEIAELPADEAAALFMDEVHPSAAGHARIAAALRPVLAGALAAEP